MNPQPNELKTASDTAKSWSNCGCDWHCKLTFLFRFLFQSQLRAVSISAHFGLSTAKVPDFKFMAITVAVFQPHCCMLIAIVRVS